MNQGAQIVDFVNAVLDAVIAIANGGKAGVPKMVEAALAASVPLLIGFLASLLGIGGLANKVKSVFHAVARPVNRAIDKIVDFITKKGKKLWAKRKGNANKSNKDTTPSPKEKIGLCEVQPQKRIKGSYPPQQSRPCQEPWIEFTKVGGERRKQCSDSPHRGQLLSSSDSGKP
ncbi:hypothetical protein NKH18_26980 [Streptomyces sp. M10(2022)]